MFEIEYDFPKDTKFNYQKITTTIPRARLERCTEAGERRGLYVWVKQEDIQYITQEGKNHFVLVTEDTKINVHADLETINSLWGMGKKDGATTTESGSGTLCWG